MRPPLHNAPDAMKDNPWNPFEDRLTFDWAHYHFVELQSSEREINKRLDLWQAAMVKAGDDTPLPWSSVEEMYRTIDEIQEGDAPFTTIHFKYSGPLHPNPPCWMTETYELCTHDSQVLLHNQLATVNFKDAFEPKPYRQFDHKNDRVWSNLMSSDWPWSEAVHKLNFHDVILSPNCFSRIQLLKINVHMGPCWCLLSLEATKQLFPLRWDIKSIIQSTNLLGILQILLDVHMGMRSFQLHSFQFQKVSI